jgi:hypothetical protein
MSVVLAHLNGWLVRARIAGYNHRVRRDAQQVSQAVERIELARVGGKLHI